MYLRTGQRGWFDEAEAWARYHMDLQAWRTDGWRWKDGGIWFPSGGPQGNRPVRKKWNFAWGPNWGERKHSPECTDLWRHAQAKSCYCHYYGSKRGYRTKELSGGPSEVVRCAGHEPPKDDTVLGVSRLFYETSHPRADAEPPEAIRDLNVRLLGDGRAEIHFTAPADRGGRRVVRYQVKTSDLPMVPYEKFDYSRDTGRKRNWWRAVNLDGEPKPGQAGSKSRFIVSGVPETPVLYFAVRSFDDSGNRSGMSNLAKSEAAVK